ncbi:MAG: phosphotransferase [Planctomycetaceae bacterium]
MVVSPRIPSLSPAARVACASWFGLVPPEVGPAPGTGFSGVPLARVRRRGADDWFVFKAFPAGTSREQAEWVHGLVRHLVAAGVTEIPSPCPTPSGPTLVTDPDGRHWELVPFVTGAATDEPTEEQAAAALGALARLHVAAARLPGVPPRMGQCMGALKAVAWARAHGERSWRDRLARAPRAADDAFAAEVAERWGRAIALVESPAGARAIASVAGTVPPVVPLQAIARDLWSAHVLFVPGRPARVTGILDLHAATIDAPAFDIGRLLGSWRRRDPGGRDEPTDWSDSLAAYEAVRPLAPEERAIVSFVGAAGTLVGLDAWFRWTLEEQRRFPVPAAAVARIDWLLAALPIAIASLAGGGVRCV